ncbi:ras-related protein Rap1-like [Lycorma delicatula]|uniref:ras-related protein Rap1-like n=1 Tax=Lycorma delicatula TaxID=130591 RepID=UPI003F513E36
MVLRSKVDSRAISSNIVIYMTMLRPIVTYCCEVWALTKGQENTLEIFENTVLREFLDLHSNVSPWDGSCCTNVSTESVTGEEDPGVPKYRVVLLGDSGVGKTALVNQFMTSEYMNTYDASLDDEFGEKTVSILLDGEESEMVFIDHPTSEMSVENSLSTYEPHACVVVYSVVNRASFKVAEEMLNYLWRENFTKDKSVIVVGNKADLARARIITSNEGKALAASRDCKFIETSSGIQHNVDELLVGILKQIRLRENREKKKKKQNMLHGSRTSLSLNIAREILHKMCIIDNKSKSCENLHVL